MRSKEIITEKLTNIIQDVEYIYKQYFAEAFAYAKKTGKVDTSLLKKSIMASDGLNSRLAKLANRRNPVIIQINKGHGNFYSPIDKVIELNIHTGAWGLAERANSIKAASILIPAHQREKFLIEFQMQTIKGSIHHELNHWIDDSLHNRHIEKHVKKAHERGISPQDNLSALERNSQIHNIVQARRANKDKWDNISFEEMMQLIPGMGSWSLELEPDEYKQWKRNLLRRMAREKLLGKRMSSPGSR